MQLYKELVVLLPLTLELPVTPHAMGWTCVRDAFPPLLTPLSIVLSLKFLCCYRIYNDSRAVLERHHFMCSQEMIKCEIKGNCE